MSLQALIQYVQHLSAKINEDQGESSHRHLAGTKQGINSHRPGEAEQAEVSEAAEAPVDPKHSDHLEGPIVSVGKFHR